MDPTLWHPKVPESHEMISFYATAGNGLEGRPKLVTTQDSSATIPVRIDDLVKDIVREKY